MGQDIRKLFSEEQEEKSHGLPKGHLKRFEYKLDREFPKEKDEQNFVWWKMAAVFLVALGTAAFFLLNNETQEIEVVETSPQTEMPKQEPHEAFALSDVSPEFKRVEDYYLASINVEIAKLNITAENKELIDSFMEQLAGLDEEYKNLNMELAEAGINEQTVEALIENLKMRLDLMLSLKQKLKELNQLENEKYQSNIG